MPSHLKTSATLSLINLISRLSGFGREFLKAYFLGVSAKGDAFQIAFTIPNLFRRLTAEGVMLNTFIPHFNQVIEDPAKAKKFVFSLYWTLLITLSAFCLLFIFYADVLVANIFAVGFQGETLKLSIFLTRIMFVYILFISVAALFQGILNSHKKFVLSALTPIMLNVVIIGSACAFYLADYEPVFGFACGVVLGGLLQALIQLPPVLKLGYRLRGVGFGFKPHLKKMLQDTIPGIAGAGIYQIDLVISNTIASGLIPGSVIALNYSNRLIELALGVFVISQTTVLFPSISRALKNNNLAKIKQSLVDALHINSFVMLPMVVIFILTAAECIDFLFGYGSFDQGAVSLTAAILILHSPGMLAVGYNRTLIIAYQANKKFKLLMICGFFTMVLNASLALFLSTKLAVSGIALASTISQYFMAVLLTILLQRHTNIKFYWSDFKIIIKHLSACIILFGALYSLGVVLTVGPKIQFLIQALFALACYIIVSKVFNVPQLNQILQLFTTGKR